MAAGAPATTTLKAPLPGRLDESGLLKVRISLPPSVLVAAYWKTGGIASAIRLVTGAFTSDAASTPTED